MRTAMMAPEAGNQHWSLAVLFLASIACVAIVVTRRRWPTDAFQPVPRDGDASPAATPATKRYKPLKDVLWEHSQALALICPLLIAGVVLLWITQPRSKLDTATEFSCTPPSAAQRARRPPALASDPIPITSPVAAARTLLRQGLLDDFSFNQLEAATNFNMAAQLDPECALCLGMVAHAMGPYVNAVFEPEANTIYPVVTCADIAKASEVASAAQRRLTLRKHSAVEEQLVNALAARFAFGGPVASSATQHGDAPAASGDSEAVAESQESAASAERGAGERGGQAPAPGRPAACDPAVRKQADREFSAALRRIGLAEKNPHILAMAVEASMATMPWEYTERQGNTSALNPQATQALADLNTALEMDPSNPLALHLKIHLLEAMPIETAAVPGGALAQAVAAADALVRSGVPDGHLQHMPSHIYVRVGRYADAVKANVVSHDINKEASKSCVTSYLPEHNLDVLVFAAAMAGDLRTAERYALEMRTLRQVMPGIYIAPGSDRTTAYLLWIQFAQFDKVRDDIVANGLPPTARGQVSYGGLQYAKAVSRLAPVLSAACAVEELQKKEGSGMSRIETESLATLLEKKRVQLGRLVSYLETHVAEIPPEANTKPGSGVGIYSMAYHAAGQIHLLTAQARVAALESRSDDAEALLRKAVALEARLGYTEPPRIHHPSRHCLAHVLLASRRWQDAADVAGEDLKEWPENGWSLLAMAHALQGRGDEAGAREHLKRAAAAFAGSSVAISNPCPAFSCVQ